MGILNSFSRFLYHPCTLYCNTSLRYPELVRSLFPTSGLFFALSLCPLDGIFWNTQFHIFYNESDSFPYFLNFVFLNLFIRTSVSSFRSKLASYSLFEYYPLLLRSVAKFPKIWFATPFKKKPQWNALYQKQQKWTCQVCFETAAGFIGQKFKKLVNKKVHLL